MGKPAGGPSQIPDEDEANLGPKMRAINLSQRRFVIAALTFPTGKDWQIAKAAGYSDKSHNALRVAAHRVFHNEKVIEALHEEASKRLRSSAVLGVSVLAKIARTDGHRDQLKAAEALLNRVGFHETSEHKVTVDHRDQTGEALEKRIRELADRLGIDAGKLLGANIEKPMRTIEHDPLANAGPVSASSSLDDGIPSAQPRDHQ